MANLAGFMPQPGPGAIYGGDWSQPYSGIMDTLLQAQQAGQQRAWDQSPSGPSFNRRFGGMLPPSLNAPSAAPMQQQADPQTLAALQGALAGSIVNSDNGTQMMEMRGQPVISQGDGSMQSQPWYNDYLNLARSGGSLPTVYGNSGGFTGEEQRGIDERRAARLERSQAGTLPMADRRGLVRNNAIAKSEQRAVRMGDMSENQQMLNELGRLQGGLGGQMDDQAQFMYDAQLYGPEVAQENQRLRSLTAEAEAGRGFQRDMQQEQLAAGAREKEADRTAARELQEGDHGFRSKEGGLNREATLTAGQSEAQLANERLRIQLEQQFRQFQAEQQAREAAAAASTTQHQETLAAQQRMNESDNAVQTAKIGQEQEMMRQQRIAALLADPTFLPEMPRDRRQMAAEQQIPSQQMPAAPAVPQQSGGAASTPLAGLQGPLGANPVRSYALESMVKAPDAGTKGFESTFAIAKQQYPDLTGQEFAAMWEQVRGYNPFSPAGEYPLIPGLMYDKLEGDAFPEYASDVRARRLNNVLGYGVGEGIPKMLGMAIPPGLPGLVAMLRGFGQEQPAQPEPQQPFASHNQW